MSRPTLTQTVESLRARCVEEGDCWIWKGCTDSHGRPQARHNGMVQYVRRLLRELTDGKPVPSNKMVPCLCGQSLCVSPACSLVTDSQGKARLASQRGAFNRPDKLLRMVATMRAKSPITDALVGQIRTAEGPCSRIAAETGVSLSHVKAIRRGAARKDYSSPFAGLFTGLTDANDSKARRTA
jgi:hypothetical protein